MRRAFLGRLFLRVLYPRTRGTTLRQVVAVFVLLLAGTAGAEQPDDPTLCGGKALPGSYAWVEPPTLVNGVLTIAAGWVIPAASRGERLQWFCEAGRGATIGWWGEEARTEFCL